MFELEEYESSKQCFQRSVELSLQQGKSDVSAQNRWIRKCESEIEGKKISFPLSGYSDVTILSTKSSLYVNGLDEAEEEARVAATTKKIDSTQSKAPVVAAKVPPKTLPNIRYQYYQSATTMNISVMAKNLTPDDVTVKFSADHLLVVVKQDDQEGI